jgi:hypothetical protein
MLDMEAAPEPMMSASMACLSNAMRHEPCLSNVSKVRYTCNVGLLLLSRTVPLQRVHVKGDVCRAPSGCGGCNVLPPLLPPLLPASPAPQR